MKCRVSLPSSVVFLLLLLFLASLLSNYIQFTMYSDPASLPLMGTYRIGDGTPALFLVFDNQGHYCRYSQLDTTSEDGTYQKSGEDNQYTLTTSTGETRQAVLTKNGVYLFDCQNVVTLYPKIASYMAFVGSSNQGWPAWAKQK